MNRRGFLKGILAAGVAPYVVTTAGVLMPVRSLWTPNPLFNGAPGKYNDLQWPPEVIRDLIEQGAQPLRFNTIRFSDIERIRDGMPIEFVLGYPDCVFKAAPAAPASPLLRPEGA